MAAPTTAACVKKTLANPEPSTHGPLPTSACIAVCLQLAEADVQAAGWRRKGTIQGLNRRIGELERAFSLAPASRVASAASCSVRRA
jgi:hypothetical protein